MVAMIRVLERIRQKIFLPLLLLSCLPFLYNMRKAEHRMSTFAVSVKSKTFLLEHCSCDRTLFDGEEEQNNSIKFSGTTCGWDAFRRGSNQKVVGFSFYGDTSSGAHQARKYFDGIEENLRLVRSQYGADWSMRLYYDLDQSEVLMDRLCELACNNNHLDLCYVRQLPGNPVKDASDIHPSLWRQG